MNRTFIILALLANYASHAAVVNVGVGLSKPITLGNRISIPAKIEFVLNPEMHNAYINAIYYTEIKNNKNLCCSDPKSLTFGSMDIIKPISNDS